MVASVLVASGWWLVAGGWWLVASGWWLVAGVVARSPDRATPATEGLLICDLNHATRILAMECYKPWHGRETVPQQCPGNLKQIQNRTSHQPLATT